MALVYVSRLEWLVRTTPLSASTLGIMVILALSVVVSVEADKHLLRRARLRTVRHETITGMRADR
jgi:hypothetical protein